MAEEKSGKDIKKILVVVLAGLGDLVMSSAAVRSLRKKFPDAEIDLLLLEQNKELGKNCPYINDLFVFSRGFLFKDGLKNFKTLSGLRKKKFDIAINLYNIYSFLGALKMLALFKTINARQSLGRNTDGKGFFYDLKVNDSINFKKHQVEYMLDVVGALGADSADKQLEVWYEKDKEFFVREFLSSFGISERDVLIGINPGGSRKNRRWPIDRFATLAALIAQKYPQVRIIITGNKQELRLAEKIRERLGQSAVITSGILGLSELIALIKLCSLYITNNTGPMHLANVLGVPVVVLQGDRLEATYPFIKEKVALVINDTESNLYEKNFLKKYFSGMRAIAMQEVMAEAEKFLGRASSSLPAEYGNKNLRQGVSKSILILAEVFFPDVIGGAGTYINFLSQGLIERGHRLTIITRRLSSLSPEESIDKIKVFRASWDGYFIFKPLAFLFGLRGILKRIKNTQPPELIIFNQPFSAFCYLLREKLNVASKFYVFQSSWGDELEIKLGIKDIKWHSGGRGALGLLCRPFLFLMYWMEGWVLHRVQRIIVLSQFSKNRIMELYGLPAERIAVVPPAIDTEHFHPDHEKNGLRRRHNLPEEKFILITVRNLVLRMGIDNLIRAFKEVVSVEPSAYLVIVGGGPLDNKLKALSTRLGLDGKIKFVGPLRGEALYNHYQLADLFILPTKYLEGFGLVTLEAMASGLPVLGTPVGGTVEILSKFGGDFLFADASTQAMSKKILEFIRSNPDLNQLGRQCREFVLKEYSKTQFFDRIEEILSIGHDGKR